MNIGLVDVDGHNFPNHALMRISAYHKAQGDTVEWADPLFADYDRVYQSKIFTFSPDNKYDYGCEVVKGGTGYDIKSILPLKELGITPFVQPYRDFSNEREPTQYERDLARWANKQWLFKSCDFADFSPRKGFTCSEYFKEK